MYMRELKEKLCEELEEIARKPEMSAGDLEAVHKLTDTIKNIDKIELLEEDGEYSRAGDWEADLRGTYGRDNSYRGRKRDSMGRYSRDHRRIYSRDGAKDEIMRHLDEMMESASSEKEREIIRRTMSQLENA